MPQDLRETVPVFNALSIVVARSVLALSRPVLKCRISAPTPVSDKCVYANVCRPRSVDQIRVAVHCDVIVTAATPAQFLQTQVDRWHCDRDVITKDIGYLGDTTQIYSVNCLWRPLPIIDKPSVLKDHNFLTNLQFNTTAPIPSLRPPECPQRPPVLKDRIFFCWSG